MQRGGDACAFSLFIYVVGVACLIVGIVTNQWEVKTIMGGEYIYAETSNASSNATTGEGAVMSQLSGDEQGNSTTNQTAPSCNRTAEGENGCEDLRTILVTERDLTEYEYTAGIWKKCNTTEEGSTECQDVSFSDMTDHDMIVAGLLIIAIILSLVAGATYWMLPATGILQLSAGVFGLASISVAGSEIRGNHIGYSLGAAVAGSGLLFFNGCLVMYLAVKNSFKCRPYIPCRDQPKQDTQPLQQPTQSSPRPQRGRNQRLPRDAW